MNPTNISAFEDKLSKEVSITIVCVPLIYFLAFSHMWGKAIIVSNNLIPSIKSSSVIKSANLTFELRVAEVNQDVSETCAFEVSAIFDSNPIFIWIWNPHH